MIRFTQRELAALTAPDAERGLLHSLLTEPNAGVPELAEDAFTIIGCRLIFRAIREIQAAGGATEPAVIAEHLLTRGDLDTAGGAAAISALSLPDVWAGSIESCVGLLRDKARRRALAQAGERLLRVAVTPGADVETALEKVERARNTHTRSHPDARLKFSVNPISAADLLRREFLPDDELLPGLLDKQGALLVSGPQKVGKSHLTVQLCFALTSGLGFLDFARADRKCRVLYLQAEMSDRRMQERIRPLAAAVPPASLDLLEIAWTGSTIKLDEAGGQATVLDLIKKCRPDVLVIDPLMNFMTGDTDKQRDMSRMLSFLDLLRFQFGIAVIVVHHHGKKAGERVGGHKALGSVALAAWYEGHLILEWHGDPRDRLVNLSLELRHAEAPEPIVLKFNSATRSFQVQTADAGPVADVLAAVRKVGGAAVTARQVSEAARKSESWARKYFDRAAELGLVTTSGGSPKLYSQPEKASHTARTGAPETHPDGARETSRLFNELAVAHTDSPPIGGVGSARVVEI